MELAKKLKDYFFAEEEYEEEIVTSDEYEEHEERAVVPMKNTKPNLNVVNLQQFSGKTAKTSVVLIEPRAYSEARDITDHLKAKKTVVINLQRVQLDQAKRIVDFLSGTVYAIGGDIQKLAPHTFICTPENVDISGAISEYHLEE